MEEIKESEDRKKRRKKISRVIRPFNTEKRRGEKGRGEKRETKVDAVWV